MGEQAFIFTLTGPSEGFYPGDWLWLSGHRAVITGKSDTTLTIRLRDAWYWAVPYAVVLAVGRIIRRARRHALTISAMRSERP